MKKLNLQIIVFTTILLFIPANTIAQKTRLLKPANTNTNRILEVNGKNRIYYPMNKEQTVINVRGPGKLKIITRVKFLKHHKDKLNYQLTYKIDGGHETKVKFNDVLRSSNVNYKNNVQGIPGVGQYFEIEVGMGQHTIELWRNSDAGVDARYVFKSGKQKKQKWNSLCPATPNEPVGLVYEENVVHYYRFSIEKPLKIKVIGPTTLRILTRIENHFLMKGRINYRLKVKEDGEIKNTYMLSSIKSEVVSYKYNKTMVPGKAREIVILVPSGMHKYEVIPLDKNKSTILGRIMLPAKDLKLEE